MTIQKIRLLVVEDESFDVKRIRRTVQPFKNKIEIVKVVSTGEEAVEFLNRKKNSADVIIMDFQIAGSLKGEALIKAIKDIDPTYQIIVVTKMTINAMDFDFANRLIEAGAMWYCTKYPGDIEDFIYQPTDFILNIFNAAEKRNLHKEKLKSNTKLQQSVDSILQSRPIIGVSPILQKIREQNQKFADTDVNLLIRGDSGTGKELIASHIHYSGRRRFENFIPINCGSLPENLIESELFGFEKGSFTGASVKKPGLFEVANKGTVFLDEITELPLFAQATLLRVIQEGEIDKIGRVQKVKVDVRIIAATNKNLEEEVREKRFREDLYYRLNVVSIDIPPLRDRYEDVVPLIDYFLNLYSSHMKRQIPVIDNEGIQLLEAYPWPGNVRELENVVQRLLFIGLERLGAEHVKTALGMSPLNDTPDVVGGLGIYSKEQILHLKEIEKEFRIRYFQFVRQNTVSDADAARRLGLAPPNYHRMCKELGLK